MTNADKSVTLPPDKPMTNEPRNHPDRHEYVCECGQPAVVKNKWDVFCAKCYIKQDPRK